MCLLIFSVLLFANQKLSDIYLTGKKLQNEKKYLEAIKEYEQILIQSSHPNKNRWLPITYFEIGICYFELNDYKNSLENFTKLIDSFPQHFLVSKAIYYRDNINNLLKKEAEKAAVKVEKNDIIDTTNVSIANEIIEETKEQSNSTEELNKILDEISEEDLYAELTKANKEFENNNYNEAYNKYFNLLKRFPDNLVIKYNLGITLIKLERYNEAINYLEEVYKKYMNDIDTMLNLAYAYQKINNLKLAQLLWEKVLKIEPNNKIAKYNLSLLKTKKK